MEAEIKAIDELLSAMETAVEKVDAFQASKVKLPRAELDLLKLIEDGRNLMTDLVMKTSKDRQKLADVFGNDCSRISRMRAVLDATVLSEMNANDQRMKTCRDVCQTIENVLTDFGLGMRLKEELAKQKANLHRRRSSIDREAVRLLAEHQARLLAEQQAATAADDSEATQSEDEATQSEDEVPPPKEIPKQTPKQSPKQSAKLKTAKTSREVEANIWVNSLDETLVEQILSCTKPEELAQFEEQVSPGKDKYANWMIWMAHRAHLDDPTLVEINFSNNKMPDGSLEPRVSPKLAVAIETNTHIQRLILPCTNLQGNEVAIIAVSLRANKTLQVLNIDSNPIRPIELESLVNAVGFNQTLQEFRCNNTASGRAIFECVLNAIKSNQQMCKLGLQIQDQYIRGEIDKQITRNNDVARRKRNEEKNK